MNGKRAEVCVIIPTTCELGRDAFIKRAIASVLAQEGSVCDLVVVVNGDRFDPKLLEWLKGHSGLRTLQIEQAHVSLARFHGVRESTSEFLSFLDDDDEFLPGALQSRIATMRAKPEVDVVVTNGYLHNGADLLLVDEAHARRIREDAAKSFLLVNWFASPASLFRRSSLDADFFDLPYKYFEWTYVFFKLIASGKKIEYSEAVTYRKFEDHALSVSKSEAYYLSYHRFLLDLLELPLHDGIKCALRRKYVAALTDVSAHHLLRKELRLACVFFMKSLANGGWTSAAPNLMKILASSRSSRRAHAVDHGERAFAPDRNGEHKGRRR